MPRKPRSQGQPQSSGARGAMDGLRKYGIKPSHAYRRAVCELRKLLLPAPPRERDSHAKGVRSTAPFQSKEHASVRPPVLEKTRAVVDGKLEHFERACAIESHPLAEVSVTLPPDLQAAVDCVSIMGDGIGPWRERQVARFQEIAATPGLRALSDRINALAAPHVR